MIMGSVEGLRVSVAPPFAIYGTNEVFIGGLNASTNVLMNLNVVGVSEGGNTLTMIMNYRDELGNDVTENKSVTLTVKKEQTDLVFSQSSDIFSKKNGLARFEVTNNGKDLKDVRLTLDQAGLIVQGGGEIRVGDIASGETKFFEFTLYPDVTPGTQSVAATVTYMEDGVEKTKGISITLDVGSDSDVQVFVDAKPLPITRGQDETLSVTVANTWDYPIQSVSVSIDGDFFDLVSVQNEQYIGLLNNDDFSSVQFKVNVKAGAPASGTLNATVKYRDPSGNWVVKKKIIPLPVSDVQAPQQGNGIFLLVGGAVVLVAAYLLFFRKKK